MGCRVGMTTDPKTRKQAWMKKHPTLKNWKQLGKYSTKTAAQAAENKFAKDYGCVASGGGAGRENDNWIVYKFDY